MPRVNVSRYHLVFNSMPVNAGGDHAHRGRLGSGYDLLCRRGTFSRDPTSLFGAQAFFPSLPLLFTNLRSTKLDHN